MNAVRRLARNVAIPLAVALLLLLVLEAGCRVAVRVRTGRWPVTRAASYAALVTKLASVFQPHPFLVVSGRPGAELSVEGHQLRFNALGLRGREIARPKPKGRYRILCEGGSTTFDFLSPDDASTWPARLEEMLSPGRDVDVANAGFPGWTSLESLVSLEIRDVDLSPNLVVVFSGLNDLQPAGHVPFTPDYSLGHADLLPRIRGLSTPRVRWFSRSVFIESLRDLLHSRRADDAEGYAPAWNWNGGGRKADIPAEAVAVYERNLRATIAVAAARGARTLLVAQAVRVRKGFEAKDREWLESWAPGLTLGGILSGLARYDAVARKLSSEGALYVDPFSNGNFTDEDFADACHFSPSGSTKFARTLAHTVEPLVATARP